MPNYYDSPGKRGSRFLSLNPEHAGQYVSRREHQKEIGKPLTAGWKQASATSKAGKERIVFSKGNKSHPIALRTLAREFSRIVPIAKAAGRESVIISIQYLNADGQWTWFSQPVPLDSGKAELDAAVAAGWTMLDYLLSIKVRSEAGEVVYEPVKTGGAQIIIPGIEPA